MVALSQLPPWPIPRRLRMLGVAVAWLGVIAFCLAAWAIGALVVLELIR